MEKLINNYILRLQQALSSDGMRNVPLLAKILKDAWSSGASVYICGNGGSAGNAIHLANDFIYGVDRETGVGIRVEALSANAAVLTCLGNDIGYENIYAQQLKVKARVGDVLIALSGSGNSPNIIKAIEASKNLGVITVGILGYSGGRCLDLVDCAIHFNIDDMQVSEDMQLIVGHMCMQYLSMKLER